jgi:hypothetical protein
VIGATTALLAAVLAAQPGSPAPEPRFEDFAVKGEFKGAPSAPRLITPGQRSFRSAIREAAGKGPNFAGHFTIAEWGCGAGCVSMAVIDEETGRVFDGPFGNTGTKNDVMTVVEIPDPNKAGFFYHRDSRLLIARGCPQQKNCAAYYFEWTGAAFKLLQRTRP